MKTGPIGLFAANDKSAISSIAVIQDNGFIVLDDLAIVTIDNIRKAKLVRPSLTTVDVPKSRTAAIAMQKRMLQKHHKDKQSASSVVTTELITRQSCGS